MPSSSPSIAPVAVTTPPTDPTESPTSISFDATEAPSVMSDDSTVPPTSPDPTETPTTIAFDATEAPSATSPVTPQGGDSDAEIAIVTGPDNTLLDEGEMNTIAYGQGFDIAFFNPTGRLLDVVAVIPEADQSTGVFSGEPLLWVYACGSQAGCPSVFEEGFWTFGFGGLDEAGSTSWPLNPGRYKVALLREAGSSSFDVLTSSPTFEVGATSISVDKYAYAISERIVVSFNNEVADQYDWIGIYNATFVDENGVGEVITAEPLYWMYSCGLQVYCDAGEDQATYIFGDNVNITGLYYWPLFGGDYRALLLDEESDGYEVKAVSEAFMIYDYFLETFIEVSKDTYEYNENIIVMFENDQNQTGISDDSWIGVFKQTDDDNPVMQVNTCGAESCPDFPFMSDAWVLGPGGTVESLLDSWPLAPGTYYVALMEDDEKLATSESLMVLPRAETVASSIIVDKTAYEFGEDIGLSFIVGTDTMPSPLDWVAIYPEGLEPNGVNSPICWTRVCGLLVDYCPGGSVSSEMVLGSEGGLELEGIKPLSSGSYVAFLMSGSSSSPPPAFDKVLASSSAFIVQ